MTDEKGLPWYGGYNFFVDRNGAVTQFRALGEETAAQIGYNFDGVAVSVCLAGNHSIGANGVVDPATFEQIVALKNIYKGLLALGVKIMDWNIGPHRLYQPSKPTQCYGNAYPDDWARKQILTPTTHVEELQQRAILLQTLVDLWTKIVELRRQISLRSLSATFHACDGGRG